MIEAFIFLLPVILGQLGLKYGPQRLKDLINKICTE